MENTDVIQLDGANCTLPCIGSHRETGKEGLVLEVKGSSLSSRPPVRKGPFLILSNQEGTTDNYLEHSLPSGMLRPSSLLSSVGHGLSLSSEVEQRNPGQAT